MKVILTKDVMKVGNRYDVLDLKEGYAQNVLISKGLAILATAHELSKLKDMKDKMHKSKEEELKLFDSLIDRMKNLDIKMYVRDNGKGSLFKSITPRDVTDLLKKDFNIQIQEDSISMPNIKSLGTYDVVLKKLDRVGEFKIQIISIQK